MTRYLISWLSDLPEDVADDIMTIRHYYRQGITAGVAFYFDLPDVEKTLKALGHDDLQGVTFIRAKGVFPRDCRKIIRCAHDAMNEARDDYDVCINNRSGTVFCRTACLILAQASRVACTIGEDGGLEVPDESSLAADYLTRWLSSEETSEGYTAIGLNAQGCRVAEPSQPYSSMVYVSHVMSELVAEALKAAKCDYPVLIEGESGTGKEVMAAFVHQNSFRSDKCFLPVNCGAVPESLAEAEFFGYKKGAFTGATADSQGYFEAADKGTLFLDEVGELPLPMQVRLLRVLQDKQITPVGARKHIDVDVRIISATNKSLSSEITSGQFREDLFHRLGVLVLTVPPLRERKDDIIPLAEYFTREINSELSKQNPDYAGKQFNKQALSALQDYSWPGNVRELKNTILRAFILSESKWIGKSDLDRVLFREASVHTAAFKGPIGDGFSLDHVLDQMAMHYLQLALETTGGKKGEAARLLGFDSRQRMNAWLKKYGMNE